MDKHQAFIETFEKKLANYDKKKKKKMVVSGKKVFALKNIIVAKNSKKK